MEEHERALPASQLTLMCARLVKGRGRPQGARTDRTDRTCKEGAV